MAPKTIRLINKLYFAITRPTQERRPRNFVLFFVFPFIFQILILNDKVYVLLFSQIATANENWKKASGDQKIRLF